MMGEEWFSLSTSGNLAPFYTSTPRANYVGKCNRCAAALETPNLSELGLFATAHRENCSGTIKVDTAMVQTSGTFPALYSGQRKPKAKPKKKR